MRVGVICTRVATNDAVGIHVSNGELCEGTHLTGDPTSQNLAALLLAETRPREVALVNEGDDIDNDLMLVQDRVDNDWHHGTEVCLSCDLGQQNDETSSLEDGAVCC